jgi:DNA-binding beta-propeller fold protein YncE/mono/diheme cytochrome c family protein
MNALHIPAMLFGLSLIAACAPQGGLDDPLHPTGSSTLVAGSDRDAAYAVNTDAGTVARVSPDGAADAEIPVGLEPTRIARAGSQVFVTLRGERRVAILSETPAGLVEDGFVDVGAEPYGIVASEDGTRVYVANSMSDTVSEIDALSRDILRTWRVPHEPRYLALHPNDAVLYVGSGRGKAHLTQIDLTVEAPDDEQATAPVPLPGIVSVDGEDDNGDPSVFELTPRITGDIAVSPNGDELVVPIVWIDNLTPVDDPVLENGEPVAPVSSGYGSTRGEGIGRFNPGVGVVGLEETGEPSGDSHAIFIGGLRDGGFAQGMESVRSYPSSVTISPDGVYYAVSMQGSDAVAIVGALPFDSPVADGTPFDIDADGVFTSLAFAGFRSHPRQLVWTDGSTAPDGVAFLDGNTAFAHSGFDANIADLDFRNVTGQVADDGQGALVNPVANRTLGVSERLTDFQLPADVEAGRKLFFSATAPGMVADGAGVSCASCHFEGRTDGLTWTFESGDRQTPTLAGEVSQTAPVTWTDAVESVAHEARITTEARMGGEGLNDEELAQIAAFVDWTRIPDSEHRGSRSDAIDRGRAIFERADVGCASCHSGNAFTDNRHHTMFGLTAVNTPTLLGIASSAPYLHDGRAPTLRVLLDMSRSGEMGDTSMLSEAEMQDLEAYLRSL